MKRLSFLPPLLLVILVNILLSWVDFRIDLTQDKKHFISKETKQILTDLEDVVFIKVYLDGDFPPEFKHLQSELLNLLTSFKSIAGDNFDYEVIDPNNTNNETEKIDLFKQLVKDGLTPTDIEIRSTSSKSSQIIFPGALIYYKDRQQAVNFLKNSVTKQAGENINDQLKI